MPNKIIMPVVGYGSPILREQTFEAENNDGTKKVVQQLYDTLNSLHSAVGLAAPQINSNLSMFIMKLGGNNICMINPRIIKRRDIQTSEEACMSIPDVSGIVPDRSVIIDVEFYDPHFNKHRMKLRGFDSVVFSHEYDHLNGILYTDHMTRQGREMIADKLFEIEKGNVKTYYDMIFFGPKKPVKFSPIPKKKTSPLLLSAMFTTMLALTNKP